MFGRRVYYDKTPNINPINNTSVVSNEDRYATIRRLPRGGAAPPYRSIATLSGNRAEPHKRSSTKHTIVRVSFANLPLTGTSTLVARRC